MSDKVNDRGLNDLLIVADDGEIYLVKQSEWQRKDHLAPKEFDDKVKQLVQDGAVLANIPDVLDSCLCVLLNLGSLRGASRVQGNAAQEKHDSTKKK